MAAPVVAGTIAMMKQRDSSIGVEEVRAKLRAGATDRAGYKFVDASRSVAAVKPQLGSAATGLLKGAIGTHYRATGGAAKYGNPLWAERGGLASGGVYQAFSKGHTFYWSPSTGAHAVMMRAGIGSKFAASGLEHTLGYPITDEVSKNGYAYQRFRVPATGKTSIIMWTPRAGAHVLTETAGIGSAWVASGREHNWGAPISGEYRVGKQVHQRFANGVTAVWESGKGVRAVR